MAQIPGVIRTYTKQQDSALFYDIDFRSDDPTQWATPKLEDDEELFAYDITITPPEGVTQVPEKSGMDTQFKILRLWFEEGIVGATVIVSIRMTTTGSVAKNFPARTYTRSIAILISGNPVGLIDADCCLPSEGDEGDVLTVVDGHWTSAPPGTGPGGGLTPPTSGGDDYKVAYALNGDLAYADNVKINAAETAVIWGTGPASTGFQQFTGGNPGTGVVLAAVRSWATASDTRLFRYSAHGADVLTVGDDLELSGLRLNVQSGGYVGIYVAGTEEWVFSSTQLDANGNVIRELGRLDFDSSNTTRGLINVPDGGFGSNAGLIVAGRTSVGTQIDILRVDSTTKVFVGDPASATQVVASVATSGYFAVRVNNTEEYGFTATHADFKANGAERLSYIAQEGTTGSSGWLRLAFVTVAGGGVVAMTGRTEAGDTTVSLVRWNVAQNTIQLGDGASGSGTNGVVSVQARMRSGGAGFVVSIGGADAWTTTGAGHDANSLGINNADFLAQPGTVPSTAWLRGTTSMEARGKNTAAGDSRIWHWGGVDVSFGDAAWSGANGFYMDAGATGFHAMRYQGTAYHVMTRDAYTMRNSNTPPTTNPSSGHAAVWEEAGVGLMHRSSDGTVTTIAPV